MRTPEQFATEQTGMVITLPAGTRIGGRRKPANEAEAVKHQMYWTGWESITVQVNLRLEVRIDASQMLDLARKAAWSKGKRSKSGPVTLKVVR